MILYSLFNSQPIYAIAFIIAYISSILVAMSVHEWAHAFVAYKQGDGTAKAMKRLSLKPFDHVDPIGFACLLIFGFGWAKSVPVDSRNYKHGKWSEFFVSIAGVLFNVIIALLTSLLYCLFYNVWPAFSQGTAFYPTALNLFLNFSIIINLSLAFFNLLPIYPLDGFRVVESFTSRNNKFTSFMRNYSTILMLLLFISGIFTVYIDITAINVSDLLILMWSKFLNLIGL